MELKRKLLTSFLLVVAIPIIMMIILGSVIVSYQLKSIRQSFDIEVDTVQTISNPMQILNQISRGVYNRIVYLAEYQPEKLRDMEYMQTLNAELDSEYSYILVLKEDEILYSGNPEFTEKIKDRLPEYSGTSNEWDGGVYISGKNPVLLKQQDFLFADGAQGMVYVITDVSKMVPQIRSSAVQAVVAFTVILIATAVILSAWLYRSIIRPLDKLKKATREIRSGNLEFEIQGNEEDEIGRLCNDFDRMRRHLKELEDIRCHYEQESRDMLANISHDMKTPLTAIKGYAEGILDGVAVTPERQEKYLKTICAKASDMSVLVDELSIYTKFDGDQMNYDFVSLYVAAYFEDCIDELKLDLEVKDIELLYENFLKEETRIFADPEQLKRVVMNIVGNSVKYTDRALMREDEKKDDCGRIWIRLKEEENIVLIEIEDNGSGIAKEDLPHIFERFYRADTARSTKHKGTGLGLAIAKKIIEDHGGMIRAESSPGAGTKMILYLPKEEVHATEKKSEEKKRKGLFRSSNADKN